MRARRIGFHAGGRLGVVAEDGSGERFLDLDVPRQQRWQFGPSLPNGRLILHSFEDTTMARMVVGDVQVNPWFYDLHSGRLEPLHVADRPSQFFTCSAAFADGRRLLVSAMVDGTQHLYLMDIDGSGCRALTHPGQGFHYGAEISPDQTRIACHVTGDKSSNYPRVYPYSIEVIEIAGGDRTMVAARTGHLYFAPVWSAAGDRLAYLDCHSAADPAHFAADLCIGHADGTAHRVVTAGQSHWFGTSYGADGYRGGGSNMTTWIPGRDRITYTRLLPDSHADAPASTPPFPITRSWSTHPSWRAAARSSAPWTPIRGTWRRSRPRRRDGGTITPPGRRPATRWSSRAHASPSRPNCGRPRSTARASGG